MRMGFRTTFVGLTVLFCAGALAEGARPGQAVPLSALEQLPVQEITVFKDGHAFILHEGVMPTDDSGNVRMDYLPRPVVGTFWPYVDEQAAALDCVVAGQRRVSVPRTALDLPALLEANVGERAWITEVGSGEAYTATIVGFPTRSAEELAASSPPNTPETLPTRGSVVLLGTEQGTKALPVSRIQDVTFVEAPETKRNEEEFRNLLTLKLDWNGEVPKRSARVGVAYLERGIRWIPSYRVTLDGAGTARLELQATVINELLDLEGVTVNLVIGVPSFMFKDTIDPISLQQTVAQLSQYFQADSQFLNLSNAMMTQQVETRRHRTAEPQPGLDLGPELGASGKEEDLFLFTVRNLTLGKGERMVVPIVEFELAYRDVYTLDIPFMPPPELARNFNTEQQRAMAKLLANPKAEHKVRLSNTSPYPLTTAPALILRNEEGAKGRLLGQGMMTYASVGGRVDLTITTAIDIKTGYSEREVKRTPEALRVDHNNYARTDLEGTIHLKNLRTDAVDLEVRRFVSGHMDEASQSGEAENGSLFDFETQLTALGGPAFPFNWPNWFSHVNGAGKASWKLSLEPGQAVDLTYQWHYFWR